MYESIEFEESYPMDIQKIYNNNIVSSINDAGEEVILSGRGLAFGKKNGDLVDESKIDKIFELKSGNKSYFDELMSEIPEDVLAVCQRIIDKSEEKLDRKISATVFLALTDHINFAITRAKEGMEINNPLLYEIKNLYRDEYKLGLKSIEYIHDGLGVELPIDEAGFIAFHLANGTLNEDAGRLRDITKITQDILNIVRYHFNFNYDEDSIQYMRFITHLKFFAQRVTHKETLEGITDEEMFELLKKKHVDTFKVIPKIDSYLVNNYGYALSTDEEMYLVLHIERLRRKNLNESVDI